jgi:hypothetical protein
MVPLVVHLVSLESCCECLHGGGFVMFGPMMWGLLNFEYFCQRNNKRRTKKLREIGVHSWYCQKAFDEWEFLEMI